MALKQITLILTETLCLDIMAVKQSYLMYTTLSIDMALKQTTSM